MITNSQGHEQTPVSQIATKDIEEKIDSLSAEYKDPFILHFEGFKYKEIADALKMAKSHIEKTKPDLIILVDYVEFNLKIAKFAKSLGIRVIFYIAPQLWAWRERRAHNLVKNIDHLAVIFPFEEIFFQRYTDNVTYVGHPLFENTHLLSSVNFYLLDLI